ncbi:uncharacterized protein LOC122080615 isoform X2 [Macadamia integrifolia]|uniref:uncharacterized protein LOC122080615 isoform X2 n=1 Tax=Macadamia integrifolia TaxID=60698 RepID=UPI001C4E8586|nr:uncharacterized protein LOC122080615 isoform X2 [Macadamia integrifolia]
MAMIRNNAAAKELMISYTVQEDYEKLLSIVRETKVIFMDVERRSLRRWNPRVHVCLKKINELYYEAVDVLDKLSYESTTRIIQMKEEKAEMEKYYYYYCMINRKRGTVIGEARELMNLWIIQRSEEMKKLVQSNFMF